MLRLSAVVALTLLYSALTKTTMSQQLAGGYRHREDHHKDPHIKEVVNFAVEKVQAARNEQLDLIKVVSCQTQVVAGTNYKVVFEAATPTQELHTFEATVYEPLPHTKQPLQLSDHKLMDKNESNRAALQKSERSNPTLLGAFTETDPASSDVRAAADFAAEQLSQQSNSLFPLKVAQVLKARTKTVAGMIFELQLKLSQEKADEQIVEVEVQRELNNKFTLQKSKTLEQ
ncbi:hypothetical protein WJX73_000741 [Symbiochloris irregularis]|uniref:Cystatin domain-containing protein n=1 Tax=Symbiochloris irregularis TaxID=706552 RepID=A0AAW1NMS9_9CHLO